MDRTIEVLEESGSLVMGSGAQVSSQLWEAPLGVRVVSGQVARQGDFRRRLLSVTWTGELRQQEQGLLNGANE